MKLLLQNIVLPFFVEDEEIVEVAKDKAKRLGIDTRALRFEIHKGSVDARKKNDIKSVSSVMIIDGGESLSANAIKSLCEKCGASPVKEDKLEIAFGEAKLTKRPLVVGMGPAGLFCGLMLAESGYRPIIIDRGDGVFERAERVKSFYKCGSLDTDSNIQFGAGGATCIGGFVVFFCRAPTIGYTPTALDQAFVLQAI